MAFGDKYATCTRAQQAGYSSSFLLIFFLKLVCPDSSHTMHANSSVLEAATAAAAAAAAAAHSLDIDSLETLQH